MNSTTDTTSTVPLMPTADHSPQPYEEQPVESRRMAKIEVTVSDLPGPQHRLTVARQNPPSSRWVQMEIPDIHADLI
jgi:hypothetical protein